MDELANGEKLDKILEAINDIKTDMAVHIAKDDARNEKIVKLHNVVFGKNGTPSLNERVRDNSGYIRRVEEKLNTSLNDLKIALWKLLAPTLAAIGLGILWLIVRGADGVIW